MQPNIKLTIISGKYVYLRAENIVDRNKNEKRALELLTDRLTYQQFLQSSFVFVGALTYYCLFRCQ